MAIPLLCTECYAEKGRYGDQERFYHLKGLRFRTSGPIPNCVKCRTPLQERCVFAYSPRSIDAHPFHRKHYLQLYRILDPSHTVCHFCDEPFHDYEDCYVCCHCEFYFHIKCVLLPLLIAGTVLELHHKDHIHPLALIENHSHEIKQAVCYCCSEPLVDSIYACFDCKFYLHKNCASPAKIHHPFHRKHSLILQETDFQRVSCKACQIIDRQQLFYRCSPCNFDLHVKCVLPPPVFDHASHEHPFTCKLRQQSYICDACGTQGDFPPYECHTCNLVVHKKCTSLPRTVKIKRHHHLLSHTYFLEENEFQSWECKICHNEVNSEHGSYSCSDCNYVVHVDCTTDVADSDDLVEPKKGNLKLPENVAVFFDESITYIVDKEIKDGEQKIAPDIIHFSHVHHLTLKNKIEDDKQCNACLLSIPTPFYSCSVCDFFLHKSCAELPRQKHHWLHEHLLTLQLDIIFKCNWCYHECSGFSYYCGKCEMNLCLRCEGISEDHTDHQGHEHRLLFYGIGKYEGKCNSCGSHIDYAFKCKTCNFALDFECLTLQLPVPHKYDRHPLTLTFDDDGGPGPLNHYCDICEQERDPNQSYYYRAICDNSVHRECVLGKYPFIKLGSYYRNPEHRHLLAFVQKIYEYPECFVCGKPCLDLALECTEFGCKYIVHWECIKPLRLRFTGKMGRRIERI